MMVNQFSRNM